MDDKHPLDKNVKLYLCCVGLFYSLCPYHILLVFALAEDYQMEIFVDMYALKAVSEISNGKVMVKHWDYKIFNILLLYQHPYCYMLSAFFFRLVIHLQIISSGQLESTSRAQPFLSGSVFPSLFSVVFKHFLFNITLKLYFETIITFLSPTFVL